MKQLLLISILLLQACATSMSPALFMQEFPEATNSKHIDKAALKNEIETGNCTVIAENRKYVAPIGFTVQGDVNNGAKGVDEWVTTDKGNAYAIDNFEWVSVGDQGTTQLIIHFDTLSCK